MANIRLSREIRDTIVSKAYAGFTLRIGQEEENTHKWLKENNFSAKVVECWLRENKLTDIVEQLPDMFFVKPSGMYLGDLNGQTLGVFQYVKFEEPTRVLTVMTTRTSPYGGSSRVTVENDPELNGFVYRIKEALYNMNAIAVERGLFIDDVRKLLDACTSLKQAIDRWPQLVELLDSELLKRHHQKSDGPTKEKAALPDIDITALNTSLVINKIAARVEE